MARNKKHPFKTFITGLICFVAIFAVVFFGIQFVTKTGIFKIPGVVYYGEGLNETELGILKNIFNEELVLDKDVSIDARTTEERPDLQPGEYLYLIEVPTNSFYENRNDVSEYEESEISEIGIIDYVSLDKDNTKGELKGIKYSLSRKTLRILLS